MIIFIPSCNRAEMAWNLCNQLKKAERIVLCVNNCSIYPYYKYKWNDNVHIQYFEFKGDPKLCHNLTFQRMLQIPDNDILVLEDDVVLCDDFLGKLKHFISLIEYKQIEKEISFHESVQRPFAFTPIYIPEKKCNYTPIVSEKFLDSIGYEVFTQKYVDGIFYMSKWLHNKVKDWFTYEQVPVLKSSSGIGRFLSEKMYKAGFNMYGISPSLIGHGDHESIQFGEKRKQVLLIAKI